MTINREVARIASRTNKIDRNHVYPLIMNGDMRINQRGSTGLADGQTVTMDRWSFLVNEGGFSMSQVTDVPSGQGFKHAIKIDCTTADNSLTNDAHIQFYQRFEGQDLALLNKGTSSAESLTVIFWAKSTVTGTFVVELKDHDNSRTVSKTTTIDSADTWEKKIVTFPGDTSTNDDFTYDNNLSFDVKIWLGAGSDYTSGTLNTTWADQTNANRAVGQTINIASSTDNNFFTTGWQLELGEFTADTCPEFQFVDQATQLKQCQRYYQSIITGDDQFIGNGHFHADDYVFVPAHFKNTMRAAPSAQVTTGTGYWATEGGNNIAAFNNIDGVAHQSNKGALFYTDGDNVNASGSYTGNNTIKLRSNNASARLALSADL